MDILKEIYNGSICPLEQAAPTDPEYSIIANAIGFEKGYFASKLSNQDQIRFEEWAALFQKQLEMVSYSSFEYGFKMASKLFMTLEKTNK